MAIAPRIQTRGNRLDKMQREPWPAGATFSIQGVALLFGKKPQTIYNLLWQRAPEFSRPKYAQMSLRGSGDRRLYRVLTEDDVRVFRLIYSVRVK